METAIGTATGIIGSLVNVLSNELVEAYVASSELGLNYKKIKDDLMLMQGLLYEAQRRGVMDNPGLQGLVPQLSAKADDAEDALDELHYFIIQDQLDGTHYATPVLSGDLQEKVQHGRNAVRYTVGNWLNCFSCSPMQDDDDASAPVTNNPPNTTKPHSGNSGPVDKLPFNRVAMSKKIKSVIEEIHSLCDPVLKLLNITPHHSSTPSVTLSRPLIGSTTTQNTLYGRTAIFEKTLGDITSSTYHNETLSVLPFVGPGGIGKTTFIQHVYNDGRTKEHFTARVWVCVSTDFDVVKLTQQIHNCIPATEKEEGHIVNGTASLDQLQISIAHRLKSVRFLIVLDDIWECSSECWEQLVGPFTKGDAKGSMFLVTTRFPKIGERVKKETIPIYLQGLDPKEFLEFFQACVFGVNRPDQKYSELIDIGTQIAHKLKCSPLAAKTVARLLKKNLSWEHWRKVLENNEWKNQTNSDDIMPALKISYDYLPFYLKQCFSFLSLFHEDHRFTHFEITCFWTAIGIIDASCKNKNYLEELVENGFLMKEFDNFKDQFYYVLHDLLHELARSVSSQVCLNISSSLSFRAEDIPQSIRHLSITMENRCDENFRKEMCKLKSRINIRNLRTLMIFSEYEKKTTEIFKETFEEIEGLRVLFIDMSSLQSLPKNFPKLLHLRYLKISSHDDLQMSLPSALPRFYHLVFFDLQSWRGSKKLPEHISRLVNLRHFIADKKLHSSVPEVGKMEHLEELKEFHVKNESVGFELEQLGKLTDLEGELCVCNLEKVATKEEANKANLVLKRNLKKLVLVWGTEELVMDADVADGLQPHDNLRELVITDGGAGVGPPSWLCHDIPIRHLESLILTGVSWGKLPPFAQLPYLKILCLKSIAGVHIIGPDLSFMHLKEVSFEDMPDLEKWVVGPNCHLFPMLESIVCKGCPSFNALPFVLECLAPCTQDIHYPSLSKLSIDGCSKLSLPPAPHTSTLKDVFVRNSDLGSMSYSRSGGMLYLSSCSGAVAFHNMGKIECMTIVGIPKFSWTHLQEITSLRTLRISKNPGIQSVAFLLSITSLTSLSLVDCENLTVDGFNALIIAVNLKELYVYNSNGSPRHSIAAELLSEVASRIKVSNPAAGSFFQLETLCVDSISAVLSAPICSLLAPTLKELQFIFDDRSESFTDDEEKALQLLASLESLIFNNGQGMPSLPEGLHSLRYLRLLQVCSCPAIRALPKGGLPTSLKKLAVMGCSAELQAEVRAYKEQNQMGLWRHTIVESSRVGDSFTLRWLSL